jgi:polyphosphate kinase
MTQIGYDPRSKPAMTTPTATKQSTVTPPVTKQPTATSPVAKQPTATSPAVRPQIIDPARIPESPTLALASDPTVPVLERVRLLAESSIHLDQCIMRFLADTSHQTSGIGSPPRPAADIPEQLARISAQHAACFDTDIHPALRTESIHIVDWHELGIAEQEYLSGYFHREIFPLIVPLAVDRTRPFPTISGQALNLAIVVRDPGRGSDMFARVKIPRHVPRFVPIDGGQRRPLRFLPLERLISANLRHIFRGMQIVEHHIFRVIRESERSQSVVDRRGQRVLVPGGAGRPWSGSATHLEVLTSMSDRVLNLLIRKLTVRSSARRDDRTGAGLLDLSALRQIYQDIDRPDLKDERVMATSESQPFGDLVTNCSSA